jgi:hypothetical protein
MAEWMEEWARVQEREIRGVLARARWVLAARVRGGADGGVDGDLMAQLFPGCAGTLIYIYPLKVSLE